MEAGHPREDNVTECPGVVSIGKTTMQGGSILLASIIPAFSSEVFKLSILFEQKIRFLLLLLLT